MSLPGTAALFPAVLTKMPGIRWAVYKHNRLKVSGKTPPTKISEPPSCAPAVKLRCAETVLKEQKSGDSETERGTVVTGRDLSN